MPRKKTAKCTACGASMWAGPDLASQPKCLPCRRAARTKRDARKDPARPTCCPTCAGTWSRSRYSRASECPECRKPRCEVCGERFAKSYSTQRTCGRVCGRSIQRRQERNVFPSCKIYCKECEYCGASYVARVPSGLHQDPACVAEHRRHAARRAGRRTARESRVATRLGRRDAELTYEERLLSRFVVEPGGCWRWTGTKQANGYGQIGRPGGTTIPAHRAVYEYFNGHVATGNDLDHECHNEDLGCPGGWRCPHRACVNPSHLVPKTRRENIQANLRRVALSRRQGVAS